MNRRTEDKLDEVLRAIQEEVRRKVEEVRKAQSKEVRWWNRVPRLRDIWHWIGR